jgi:hypothetical protein
MVQPIGIGTHLCQIVVQLGLQLHLLAAISWFCVVVLFLAAQGLCNMLCYNTARYNPWYVSDRINTREQACTYIHFVLLL